MTDTINPTPVTPVADAAVAAPVVAAVVAAKPVIAKTVAAKPVAAKVVAAKIAKPAKVAKPVAVGKKSAKTIAAAKPATTAKAAKPISVAKLSAPILSKIVNRIKKETNMTTTFENAAETIKSKLTNGAEAVTAQTKAAYEQASTTAREALAKGMKSVEAYNSMNRDNVEAIMASGRIAAKGLGAIGSQVAEVSKKNFDANVSAFKSLSGLKSFNEIVKFQSDFAKSQFNVAVADFSKLTETVVKLAGEVIEPISNRVAMTVDKVSKSVAK